MGNVAASTAGGGNTFSAAEEAKRVCRNLSTMKNLAILYSTVIFGRWAMTMAAAMAVSTMPKASKQIKSTFYQPSDTPVIQHNPSDEQRKPHIRSYVYPNASGKWTEGLLWTTETGKAIRWKTRPAPQPPPKQSGNRSKMPTLPSSEDRSVIADPKGQRGTNKEKKTKRWRMQHWR